MTKMPDQTRAKTSILGTLELEHAEETVRKAEAPTEDLRAIVAESIALMEWTTGQIVSMQELRNRASALTADALSVITKRTGTHAPKTSN